MKLTVTIQAEIEVDGELCGQKCPKLDIGYFDCCLVFEPSHLVRKDGRILRSSACLAATLGITENKV